MNDDIIKAVCAAVVLGEGENYEPVHLEPREARQAIAAYHAALADRPVQEPVARVSDYRKSDGTTDFYVMIGKGESAISLNMHKIRGRAEYEAAEINHALTGSPKPEFSDFDLDTSPAAPQPAHGMSATDPAPAVNVVPLEWTARIGCDEFFSDTIVGRYEIGQIGKFIIATVRTVKEGQWEDEVFAHCLSVEKAKSAAQVDFARRVTSALFTQPPAPILRGISDDTVERVAKALALDMYPDTRWPRDEADANSGIDDRQGRHPISWHFANKCRSQARVAINVLAAAPETACEICGGRHDNDVLTDICTSCEARINEEGSP
jgi:hypothetical protein